MSRAPLGFAVFLVAVEVASSGCSEVRGRRKYKQASRFYKDGQYQEAVAAFEEAEKFVPNFPVLWLNKGYTCRRMLIPGVKTPESIAASKCALAAFKRLQELKPNDTQAEGLYIQTLFDSDEFEALANMFQERFNKNPKDVDSVTGLIQVYSKWNKLDESLEWYAKKAELQATEPAAQYAVSVFIWQQLSAKGGGPDKASFDPRPDPNKKKDVKVPPPGSYGDIVSQQRVDMADKGIQYLEKAIALRPKYHEAMTYVNLLYRQKSFAFFDQPEEWQKTVDLAETWRRKSLETQGKPVPATPVAAAATDDPNDENEDAGGKPAGKSGGGK